MIEPKNLLFILSDNHARNYSNAYGHPDARMPNLDGIAENGVRFDNAYSASPLCCPARAALATGRYPHQTGFWDNAIVYDGTISSWMHRLRQARHPVVSVGKLHFRESTPANGFAQELLPMHILNGKGGVQMLLRGHDAEPVNKGQWDLYMSRSGIGVAPYQPFDRAISDAAIDWLEKNGSMAEKPWVLFVSYPSPHPPFSVPEEFYNLFDEAGVTLPATWQQTESQSHAGVAYRRRVLETKDIPSEQELRKVVTGYLGLLAHLDGEIGKLLGAIDALDLRDETRVLYTSDHGELCGAQGMFGKSCLYEEAIGIPLVMSGPDIPAGGVVKQITSHVDLFPTVLECVGASLEPEDADLPGISLWPAIQNSEKNRIGFAEYHAAGSKSSMFMLRDDRWKLIYHVGMPAQLFDLEADPDETRDLGPDHSQVSRLVGLLRDICDPEAVDAQAKADQREWIEKWGGIDAVLAEGVLVYTPPPGGAAEIEHR